MESDDSVTGPINLGNPVEFTMIALAEIIIELCGSESKVEFHSLPSDDPKQRQPDISSAEKILDWIPQVNLRDGLKACLPYYSAVASPLAGK
jgi:UDP-glucuronate decarboxylase